MNPGEQMTTGWLLNLVIGLALVALVIAGSAAYAYLRERRELRRVQQERERWERAVADLRRAIEPSEEWKAKAEGGEAR